MPNLTPPKPSPPVGNPRGVVARARKSGKYSGPISPTLTSVPQVPIPNHGIVLIRIRELMIARGMVNDHHAPPKYRGEPSINQLSRASGIPRDKIWQILKYPETMKFFTFDTIARLCFALKCQPGDFLSWQGTFTSFDRIMSVVREAREAEKYAMGLSDASRQDAGDETAEDEDEEGLDERHAQDGPSEFARRLADHLLK